MYLEHRRPANGFSQLVCIYNALLLRTCKDGLGKLILVGGQGADAGHDGHIASRRHGASWLAWRLKFGALHQRPKPVGVLNVKVFHGVEM